MVSKYLRVMLAFELKLTNIYYYHNFLYMIRNVLIIKQNDTIYDNI